MKYYVIVNDQYLTSIDVETDSCLVVEDLIFDQIKIAETALAIKPNELQHHWIDSLELISLEELTTQSNNALADRITHYNYLLDEVFCIQSNIIELSRRIADLTAQHADAKAAAEAHRQKYNLLSGFYAPEKIEAIREGKA